MLTRTLFAVTLLLAAAGLARADQVVVVELYTSQGCSSCPPADALMGQLAERDNIIGLALHVDYWDYIGWEDDFADPAHTTRQRAYARAKGKKMIYTPQMVVQGETHIVGTKPMDLMDALEAHSEVRAPVSVLLERSGDRVELVARAEARVPRDMVVQIVTYIPRATREIRRGENAGRTLTYHNIVDAWRTIGTWNGTGVYRAAMRLPEDRPVVAIVQAPEQGPVLGAARLR
ncbi:MAG: DUF1223 domain-containing protein [Paracoccaceae bacterium]|nr:DUF1223 domain-containing protein [Paracoccaceae bacterium]